MPRITSLLLVCTFFQSHLCWYDMFEDEYGCKGSEWFQCDSGECISFSFLCDGERDCDDNSDEHFCSNEPTNPPHIICAEDEYSCINGDCIPSMKFCDAVIDCSDKSDEYRNCVKDLKCDDKFRCNDQHCILKEWVCDGRKDCPDGSDELNCRNKITTSNCHNENDQYLCENERCIPFNMVCNNKDNCGDGSDEGSQCKSQNCLTAQCSQQCRQTPKGPVCMCYQGYKLQDNRTCVDIDECQIYGICDQKCVNNIGSYKCSCETDYILLPDKRTCEANGGEATMVFSTPGEIRTMYLKSKLYFVSVKNVSHAKQVTIDGDYIYWSNTVEDNYETIMRINSNEKREVIVRTGLKTLSGLAVDWITHNIYFVDNSNNYIGVCDNSGIYCTKLINEKYGKLDDIALFPTNGTMYLSRWDFPPCIQMAGMDGKNIRIIISKNVGLPKSVTIDYPNNRLYWIDTKLNHIESAHLDGTDRRIILQDVAKHPFSLAIFENKIYWSDWEHNTIQYCDKFSEKDWHNLAQLTLTPYDMNIDHPAIKPKFKNPCFSKPCPELCLLNQNKNYTCACILGKKLSTDNYTCQETEKKQHFIIVAGNTFINYYHELLGNPRTTVSQYTRQITAITCDLLSGTILASDESTNNIIRYDPVTGNIENLLPFEIKTLGGMAFDYIGNNLYLSNIKDNTIEVYSLTTMNKTIFYLDERPCNIALVPEEGKMFVAYKAKHKESYSIDEREMNGIGPRKTIRNGLEGPKISLYYDRDTKSLHWSIQNHQYFYTYSKTGELHLTNGMKDVASLVSVGKSHFWTVYDSNTLYYTSDNDEFFNSPSIAFYMSVTAKNPLVVPLYKIVIHEKYGCQNNNGNCSHVCLPSSATSFICACPPEMMLSVNNRTCTSQSACPNGEIKCSEHDICIKKEQLCDGTRNCPNGEDEMYNCKETGKCTKDQFMCKNGSCINLDYRCNSYFDCIDNSDEEDCFQTCLPGEFECHDKTCISNSVVCDDKFDCPDFSDEFLINCVIRTCLPEQFKCSSGKCIPEEWLCDGEYDCSGGEDETINCNSRNLCGHDQIRCANHRCISSSLKCNGINDCGDNSDETFCLDRADGHSGNCTKDEYNCFNTNICLPQSVRCNGVQDCLKNDDEHDCAFCHKDEFTCGTQKCIPQSWVCDKHDDCGDESDEKDCGNSKKINIMPSVECKEFKCSTGTCLPFNKVCNGVQDCIDNSDEGGKCMSSCLPVIHACKDLCYKTPQGAVCGCKPGYRLANDTVSCIDINECEHDVCSQICRNTVGSFKCSCFTGYFIRDDRISCKAIGPPMEIITATNEDIRNITSDLKSFEVIYSYKVPKSIISFDVNAIDNSIYWINGMTGSINKLNLKTKELVSTSENIGNPEVLAVDWVTNNIYVNNNGYPNAIKACNLEQNKCTTVVKIKNAARVSVIVLDPRTRWLFWSQVTWKMTKKSIDTSSKIYRSDLMGAEMKNIVFENIKFVSGMAIDYMKARLYWSDSLRKTIESSNLDGTQRSIFLNTDSHQPLSINIYENSLYWLMGSSGILQKCKLYGDKSCTTINIGAGNVHEHFAILHVSRQPEMENPCKYLNCDYMCVQNAQYATCICQDGKPLPDNSSCTKDTNVQMALATKINDTSKNTRRSSSIYSIIIIGLLIAAFLMCAYYYYQKYQLKLKTLSDQSFDSIRFYNPSYDQRDEIAVTLSSIIPESDVSPGQHEYTNPMNDPINSELLKVMEENNTKRSEKNSKQWKEIEETEIEEKQEIYFPKVRQKSSEHN